MESLEGRRKCINATDDITPTTQQSTLSHQRSDPQGKTSQWQALDLELIKWVGTGLGTLISLLKTLLVQGKNQDRRCLSQEGCVPTHSQVVGTASSALLVGSFWCLLANSHPRECRSLGALEVQTVLCESLGKDG